MREARADTWQSTFPKVHFNLPYHAYLQELCACTEVAGIELVRHIPANGPEFAALLHNTVQEAHDKQQLPPLLPANSQTQRQQ